MWGSSGRVMLLLLLLLLSLPEYGGGFARGRRTEVPTGPTPAITFAATGRGYSETFQGLVEARTTLDGVLFLGTE